MQLFSTKGLFPEHGQPIVTIVPDGTPKPTAVVTHTGANRAERRAMKKRGTYVPRVRNVPHTKETS